jgi:hypothetical protein
VGSGGEVGSHRWSLWTGNGGVRSWGHGGAAGEADREYRCCQRWDNPEGHGPIVMAEKPTTLRMPGRT